MKKIFWLMAGLTVASAAWADPTVAIMAFQKSELTQAHLKSATSSLQNLHGERTAINHETPTAALLNSSCGFAGCNSTYLVTQGLTPDTINAQTLVVGAKVDVIEMSGHVRKILDPAMMKKLQEAVGY